MKRFLPGALMLLVAASAYGQNIWGLCSGQAAVSPTVQYPPAFRRYIAPPHRAKPALRGYRIQLLATSRRQEAMKYRQYLLRAYPNLPIYLTYQNPYFKIRIGNFRTRIEAYSLWPLLKSDTTIVHRGFFVVPDRIEWPPLP